MVKTPCIQLQNSDNRLILYKGIIRGKQVQAFLTELSSLINDHAEAAEKLFSSCTTHIQNEIDLVQRAELIEQLDNASNTSPALMLLSNALLDRVEYYDQLALPKESNLVLRELMKQKRVKQKDLANIATQSIISEILNGKRNMTVKQIKGFAEFFNVPVSVFMQE